MNDKEAFILLNMVSGLGIKRLNLLLETFGSAVAILTSKLEDLQKLPSIGFNIALGIRKVNDTQLLEQEFKLIRDNSVVVHNFFDDEYPFSLKQIYDPPILIYRKGKIGTCNNVGVGIVGSRKASSYGLKMARDFSSKLAEAKIVVVSGLARGIDTASHKAVLESRGATVAVLGSGLANIYPVENKALAEQITKTGELISEFPMKEIPKANNFPRRNRIISALSRVVLVVEAAQKSGALITADFALEQGKDVYAVPGDLDNPNSAGTNNLIKQGAGLIESAEELLKELSLDIKKDLDRKIDKNKKGLFTSMSLSEEQLRVISILSDDPVDMENIVQAVKINPDKLMDTLIQLEMNNLIKQLPGKRFVLKKESFLYE
ncbi:MAG: DNA-processing protein DprA [Candidatus Gygaella obscura]|nr:DNA-processing protein DprA [Candidatus Gygaella obscura]